MPQAKETEEQGGGPTEAPRAKILSHWESLEAEQAEGEAEMD